MMEANVYENEFKVKEINSHLRFWENGKEITNNNFISVFFGSNYNDFRFAFQTFCVWNRYNLVQDTPQKISNLNSLLSNLVGQPIFSIFLLHENIDFVVLQKNIENLANRNEIKIEELEKEIPELGKILIYVNFYIEFIQENVQNPSVLNGLTYDICFNTQGTTDFLIDFPKKVRKDKILYKDFPRAQENADNETKRIITVWQLVAFYDHSWLNSNKPPDEITCKFWIAIDSLLTEEQSNRLSYINNADINELTEAERNLRRRLNSQDFRNMVINYWESTFLELTDFVEGIEEKDNDGETTKSYKIDLNNLPDENRFQRIMYFPDNELSPKERLLKNTFLQEAAKDNNEVMMKRIFKSLNKSKQIEMSEELQNMIKEIDKKNFESGIKDDDIHDDFLNLFSKKIVSQKQILQDILNGNCIGYTQPLKNIIKILFKDCDEEKKKEIILKLLSSKSKLKTCFKAELLLENLELVKDKGNQVVKIFPNDDFLDDFLNELYSGNLNNIYYFTIAEVIFLKFPIEKNNDKIMNLLSLKSKLSYEAKECLLHNFFKMKFAAGEENFNLLALIADERLSMKEKNLILIYKKGSGFLKNCYEGEIAKENFENNYEFYQAINYKLSLYPKRQKKVLKSLLSKKSKLTDSDKFYIKGSGFLKYSASGKITEKDFESKDEFVHAIIFKLRTYPDNKLSKILERLLSEKSKLSDDIKQSLQINYFELIPGSIKMLARGELTLNKEIMVKFFEEIFAICQNDPKKIFELLIKICSDKKTTPELKTIIYAKLNHIMYNGNEYKNPEPRSAFIESMLKKIHLKNGTEPNNLLDCDLPNYDKSESI